MNKYIIFDMDGVIIDSEPLHYQAFKDYSLELGLCISDEEYNTFIGTSDIEIYSYLKEKYKLEKSVSDMVNEYIRRYYDLLREAKDIKPIAGVDDLIKNLYKSGTKIGLASSASSEGIHIVLKMFRLNEYFHTTISSSNVKRSKPAPDIFLYAAKILNAPPDQCIVIEDSKNGIEAAKAAGMKCIAFRNLNSGNQDLSNADLIIEHFDELDYDKLINGQYFQTV